SDRAPVASLPDNPCTGPHTPLTRQVAARARHSPPSGVVDLGSIPGADETDVRRSPAADHFGGDSAVRFEGETPGRDRPGPLAVYDGVDIPEFGQAIIVPEDRDKQQIGLDVGDGTGERTELRRFGE